MSTDVEIRISAHNALAKDLVRRNWMEAYLPDYTILHERINALLDLWREEHGQAQVSASTSKGQGSDQVNAGG